MRKSLVALVVGTVFLSMAAPASADEAWEQLGLNAHRSSETWRGLAGSQLSGLAKAWAYRVPTGGVTEPLISPFPVLVNRTIWFQAKRCPGGICRSTPVLGLGSGSGVERVSIRLPSDTRSTLRTAFVAGLGDGYPTMTDGPDTLVGGGNPRWGDHGWRFGPRTCVSDVPSKIGVTFILEHDGAVCVVDWSGNLVRAFGASTLTDAGPPAMSGATVVFGAPGGARAYDWTTGAHLWTQPVSTTTYPVIAGHRVVFTGASSLDVRSISTGSHLRTIATGASGVAPMVPAYDAGTLYVSTTDGRVRAIDAATGDERWGASLGGTIDPAKGRPQPVVANGVVYVGLTDPTPRVVALDATTGAVVGSFDVGGTGLSSMIVMDHGLYAIGFDRVVAWRLPRPEVTSFAPIIANPGEEITITGAHLEDTLYVFLGSNIGSHIASFVVDSPTQLRATVPVGVPAAELSGPITVMTTGGIVRSHDDLTVLQRPRVLRFTPSRGGPGALVTIVGRRYTDVKTVRFAGVEARFRVLSPTEIHARVPFDTTNGVIVVRTAGGADASDSPFHVVATVVGRG